MECQNAGMDAAAARAGAELKLVGCCETSLRPSRPTAAAPAGNAKPLPPSSHGALCCCSLRAQQKGVLLVVEGHALLGVEAAATRCHQPPQAPCSHLCAALLVSWHGRSWRRTRASAEARRML